MKKASDGNDVALDNDLNAMREAMGRLTCEQMHEFTHQLGKILYGEKSNRNDWCYIDFLQAGPEKLAEAFLKTIKQDSEV